MSDDWNRCHNRWQTGDKLVPIFKCFPVPTRRNPRSRPASRHPGDGQSIFIEISFAIAMETVVGISGASGTVYGTRLLELLPGKKTVIVSKDALRLAKLELGMSKQQIYALADRHFENEDMAAPIASGSVRFEAMVIAPCSTSTLSKIACGISDNLMTRVASVALKERRPLVLVVREAPLSSIILANMERLALAGATILPACPGFYPKPQSVDEMVDFVVGRTMDQLGVENRAYRRWQGDPATDSRGPRRTRR